MMNVSRRSVLAGGSAAMLRAATPVQLGRKVRVAVWGLDGHPGEITKPLASYPDVELAAVCDANQQAAERYAKGRGKLYTDPIKMLDEIKPDVVAVDNDNGGRAAAIVECAQRKMHVISEKPLALNREDLARVKNAVNVNGVKLGMLMPMRMEQPFLALREIAKSGEIGDVIQISAQKSYVLGTRPQWMQKRASYGSTILWIGIHQFDLMRWCSLREMTETSGFMGMPPGLSQGDMETTTVSAFKLDNGGTGTLHMDYSRPASAGSHGDDRLRLAGTKGIAEYMAATGVTLLSGKEKPRVVSELPEEGSIFGEFLEHVYLNKPTGLPHSEIFRLCDITIAAHEAAVSGRVVKV